MKQEGGGRFVNTVFAQYRKVKRQRNKWACELLAGVATIDGMDHAFSKCDAVLFYS